MARIEVSFAESEVNPAKIESSFAGNEIIQDKIEVSLAGIEVIPDRIEMDFSQVEMISGGIEMDSGKIHLTGKGIALNPAMILKGLQPGLTSALKSYHRELKTGHFTHASIEPRGRTPAAVAAAERRPAL